MQSFFDRWLEPEKLKLFPLTIAIGVAGGVVFKTLGMPAAWLTGAVVATAGGALAGMKLAVPQGLRELALVFLGVSMGSAVTPATLALMARWPAAIAGLLVVVPLIMMTVAAYLQRVHGFDTPTARLAAIPGALQFTLALTAESTADARKVLVVQLFRLALLAIVLPSLLVWLGSAGTVHASPRATIVRVHEILLLMAAGLAGRALFSWLGLPAAALFGAMVASALCFGSGLVTTALPFWLLIAGNVVVGCMTGSSFTGTTMKEIAAVLPAACGAVLVGASVGLAFAWPVAALLGMPVAQVWLAYAPGGVETMAVIALALGLDVAFVGAHHVARFFWLGLIVPVWMRRYLRSPGETARPDGG